MKSVLFDNNTISYFAVFYLFIATVSLSSCSDVKQQVSLQHIIDRGYVTVGTIYGLTNYYIGADGDTGFEYELAKKYADHLGVELKISASYSLESLFLKLQSGDVDFLAAGLSVTEQRLKKFRFAPSYSEISQKLVFKQGQVRPRTIKDLTGNLVVAANSSHVENLNELKASYNNLNWQENQELDNEELLIQILDEKVDYTIIDSSTLAISRRYYPEISVGFTIKKAEPVAWMLANNDDDSLLASLVEFFGKIHHDGSLLALDDKYYGHIEKFDYVDTRVFIKAVENILPKYKDLFQQYSQDMDWRLLAAISYQESHWQPDARSYTGVRGLMMLTLATAKQMGIESRLDAEQSIRGGAKYFKQMFDRTPDRVPEPDKLWFALASYNVGLGHLNDARIITQRQGGDPDRWVDVKERLPLLKQKKYYKNTKYGYARGDEPVHYVENIRRYYDTLTWIDDKSQQDKKIAQQSATEANQSNILEQKKLALD